MSTCDVLSSRMFHMNCQSTCILTKPAGSSVFALSGTRRELFLLSLYITVLEAAHASMGLCVYVSSPSNGRLP